MRKTMAWAVGAMLMSAVASQGAIYIYEEFFEGSDNGWAGNIVNEIGLSGATFTHDPGQGNPGDAMTVDATVGAGIFVDRAYADSGSSGGNFAGNVDYTQYLSQPRSQFISFDFFNYSLAAPSGLQVFFTSTSHAGALWVYNLGGPFSSGWNSFSVPMAQDGNWVDLNFAPGSFASAIADVDEIGIRIQYRQNEANEYRIDNFRRGYEVPEPGTMAALGFAFASMGITFRRRLNEAVAKVRGMFKA
jgi:hypothetical protein